MTLRAFLPLLTSALLIVAATARGETATPKGGTVYDFAVENPVDDSPLPVPPTLGESVPRTVSLVPMDDGSYAYFYYDGRPVIVDVATRSVVRLGQ